MKKTFLACALALGMLTMSSAQADNCCYGPQFDPCCYAPDFNGFYVGGNVGVFSHTAHRNDYSGFFSVLDTTVFNSFSRVDTSWEAGLQIGYDWQCCNKVFGLVWDWNWTDVDRRHRFASGVEVGDFNSRHQHQWFTTLRARAGLTVCDALVYVTLGGVWARFENRWARLLPTPLTFNDRRTRCGWAAGAGTEFIVWCNWSIGIEVLWLHFAEHTRSFAAVGTTGFRFGSSDNAYIGRVLLNYRFGDLFGCCM